MNDPVRASAAAMWTDDLASSALGDAAIPFVRLALTGDALAAEAAERMQVGRSGIYDVRISTAQGELVAEFRGQTRTIRGRAEG